jgi:hypothetical protein
MPLQIQPFQFSYQPIQARTPPPSAPVWGPVDVSKELMQGIAGVLPALGSAYKGVNQQMQSEAAGREWMNEAQKAAALQQPGGPYAPAGTAPVGGGLAPGGTAPVGGGLASGGKLPAFAGGTARGETMTTPVAGEVAASVNKYAAQYGLDPKDVLTAMSYETGGTLDPWKAGPTTKWGQHRGLIQWGEPQRQQYGISKDSSVDDQVQASLKYLADRGVKPGMGLIDIYSAINAGGVGPQYQSRSDAAAGGAPGTVADKVASMGGHARRADLLLSGLGRDTKWGGADDPALQPPGSRPPAGPQLDWRSQPGAIGPDTKWGGADDPALRARPPVAVPPGAAGVVPPAGQPTQQQIDNWKAIVANPRSPPPMLEDAKANLAKYTARAPGGSDRRPRNRHPDARSRQARGRRPAGPAADPAGPGRLAAKRHRCHPTTAATPGAATERPRPGRLAGSPASHGRSPATGRHRRRATSAASPSSAAPWPASGRCSTSGRGCSCSCCRRQAAGAAARADRHARHRTARTGRRPDTRSDACHRPRHDEWRPADGPGRNPGGPGRRQGSQRRLGSG